LIVGCNIAVALLDVHDHMSLHSILAVRRGATVVVHVDVSAHIDSIAGPFAALGPWPIVFLVIHPAHLLLKPILVLELEQVLAVELPESGSHIIDQMQVVAQVWHHTFTY